MRTPAAADPSQPAEAGSAEVIARKEEGTTTEEEEAVGAGARITEAAEASKDVAEVPTGSEGVAKEVEDDTINIQLEDCQRYIQNGKCPPVSDDI